MCVYIYIYIYIYTLQTYIYIYTYTEYFGLPLGMLLYILSTLAVRVAIPKEGCKIAQDMLCRVCSTCGMSCIILVSVKKHSSKEEGLLAR